jgi:hypothetical protein
MTPKHKMTLILGGRRGRLWSSVVVVIRGRGWQFIGPKSLTLVRTEF